MDNLKNQPKEEVHMNKTIYLASSWRNEYQPGILDLLRCEGFEVYDYRNPKDGGPQREDTPDLGFSWRQTDGEWGMDTPDLLERYLRMLEHPIAERGFTADFEAMKWADACVLLLPCGRSAHLEAGWMAGAGRDLVVYMPPLFREGSLDRLWAFEPELMYLIGGNARDVITTSPSALVDRLRRGRT